jgi:hypothetical protein
MTTRRITIPKTTQMKTMWSAKRNHNDSQNVRRAQLGFRRRITVVKGTSVPNSAVCHLCGMPALSKIIAISTAATDTIAIIAFSVHGLRGLVVILACIVDTFRRHCPDHIAAVPQEPAQDRPSAALNCGVRPIHSKGLHRQNVLLVDAQPLIDLRVLRGLIAQHNASFREERPLVDLE